MEKFSERELWILVCCLQESTGFGRSASATIAAESCPGLQTELSVNGETVRVAEVRDILMKIDNEFDKLEGLPH